jgi:hypothetical protein
VPPRWPHRVVAEAQAAPLLLRKAAQEGVRQQHRIALRARSGGMSTTISASR